MDLLSRRGASPLRIKIDAGSSPLKKETIIPKVMIQSDGKEEVFISNSTKNTPKDLNVSFNTSKIRKSSSCDISCDMKTPDISPIFLNEENSNKLKNWISPYIEALEKSLTPLMNISLNFDYDISKNKSFHDLNKSFKKYFDVSQDISVDSNEDNSSILSDDIFEVIINSSIDKDFFKILHKNSLTTCIPIFKEHEIDLDVFLTLTRNDLQEIGIELSLQDKILNLINQLHNIY